MGYRLSIHTKLIAVMGVLLVTAGSPRAVEAIPLLNAEAAAADMCGQFDCGAGFDMSDLYSFGPDPDGTLVSFAAPGVDEVAAGLWLYAYQLDQDAGATTDVTGLAVGFPGLFPEGFSFYCADCEGTEAPSLADYLSESITFSFFSLLLPGQKTTFFGAISTFAPSVGLVGVLGGDDATASAMAFVPGGVSEVPEPGTLMLLGAGVAAVAVRRWTRKR